MQTYIMHLVFGMADIKFKAKKKKQRGREKKNH